MFETIPNPEGNHMYSDYESFTQAVNEFRMQRTDPLVPRSVSDPLVDLERLAGSVMTVKFLSVDDDGEPFVECVEGLYLGPVGES